jgi:hypothetical protein
MLSIYRELLWILTGSNTNRDLIPWRIKMRFMSQYTPGHPCQLVRKRDGQFVSVHTVSGSRKPLPEAEVRPSFRSHQNDLRSLHKEHAQISAATL